MLDLLTLINILYNDLKGHIQTWMLRIFGVFIETWQHMERGACWHLDHSFSFSLLGVCPESWGISCTHVFKSWDRMSNFCPDSLQTSNSAVSSQGTPKQWKQEQVWLAWTWQFLVLVATSMVLRGGGVQVHVRGLGDRRTREGPSKVQNPGHKFLLLESNMMLQWDLGFLNLIHQWPSVHA